MKQKGIRSFFSSSGQALKRPRLTETTAIVKGIADYGQHEEGLCDVQPSIASERAPSDGGVRDDDRSGPDVVAGDGLFSTLNQEWRHSLSAELKKPYIRSLEEFVTSQYSTATVFPPREVIFTALNICPLSEVKVVVIGQDPYHGPNQVENLLCTS